MKRLITAIFIAMLLSGCSAPGMQEKNTGSDPELTKKTESPNTIQPFEKVDREFLPLPDKKVFSDNPMEFVDTLIQDYEVMHFDTLNSDFAVSNMEVSKNDDGYLLKGMDDTMYKTGSITFAQPLNEYFSAPKDNFAVLTRFKSDEIDLLRFTLDEVTLDFFKGEYPAIDIHGDFYGDPMLYDNWNNYIYQPREWVYVLMIATNHRQRSCYIWGEDDAGDNNFHTSFSEDASDTPPEFYIRLNKLGEVATVSDIWLFSY